MSVNLTMFVRALVAAFATLTLAPAHASGCLILVHGDSLSAAYGLRREDGWVKLLEARLATERPSCKVHNSSISGETTAGGAARFPSLLQQHKPSHVVLELGGNDGLRGLEVEAMERNLLRMGQQAKAQGAKVLVVGIRIPPNYGRTYNTRFESAFSSVARQLNAPLVPSLLQGLEADRLAFQPDGIHPTAAVQTRLLDNVWPTLNALLKP